MIWAMVNGKLTSWEEHLLLIMFAYNYIYYYSIGMTSFECLYNFNSLTPLDLTPLYQDVIVCLDAKKRDEAMRNIYEKESHQLEKINDKSAARKTKKERE